MSDSISLLVPPQAQSGNYTLVVGLYDAASGERLPVLDAPDFGANRFALTSIIIR